MSLTSTIIQILESSPQFDNRYTNLKCFNYNPKTGKRQGVFSLIFEAIDSITNERVVIKIFDPDRVDSYRLQCFEREAELLKKVISKKRCLQLVKFLDEVKLEIPVVGDTSIPISLKYFVTEYLPISILNDFYSPSAKTNNELIDRVKIFREIVLAIAALHRYEIAHRDLKPDNLRGYIEELKHVVVAIDYGTAVSANQNNIATSYVSSVGASGYASPEALIGLAGDRDIDHYSDYYAIGCLLFELFDFDYLYQAINLVNNKKYFSTIDLLRNQIDYTKDIRIQWDLLLDKYAQIIHYPKLKIKHGVPPSINHYMNDILKALIQFDYRKRVSNLFDILKQIDVCIKILENEAKYEKLKQWKQRRKENLLLKEDRKIIRYQQNGAQ